MNRHGENTPAFFARLADGLTGKQHPPIVSLSGPIGSPAPQTSLSTSFQCSISLSWSNPNLSRSIFSVFQLPDELILSILSHISPEPYLTGRYARYCVQYCMKINDDHQQRMRILRRLSMTCKAMRLRLLPWTWDLIQPPRCEPSYLGGRCWVSWNFAITTSWVAFTDKSLATRVKYFCALLCP